MERRALPHKTSRWRQRNGQAKAREAVGSRLLSLMDPPFAELCKRGSLIFFTPGRNLALVLMDCSSPFLFTLSHLRSLLRDQDGSRNPGNNARRAFMSNKTSVEMARLSTNREKAPRPRLPETDTGCGQALASSPSRLVMCLPERLGVGVGGRLHEGEAGGGFVDLGAEMVASERSREPRLTTSCLKSILS